MREIRQSGSEGGGADDLGSPYPYQSGDTSPHSCAWEGNEPARCKSLSGLVWSPVTEGNCVLVRGGGEQPQVKLPSAAQANSIRPAVLASFRVTGEAQDALTLARGSGTVATTVPRGKPGGHNPRHGFREGSRWVEAEGTDDSLP